MTSDMISEPLNPIYLFSKIKKKIKKFGPYIMMVVWECPPPHLNGNKTPYP